MKMSSLICDLFDHKFANPDHEIKFLANDGTNTYLRAKNICTRCGKVIEWNFSVYDPQEKPANNKYIITEWPL